MSTTSKCPENANVDQTGACQCNDGYITATCAEKCSNGTYGFACGKECTSCPWEQCNHITGCPLPGTTPPGGSTPSQNEIIIYITLLSSVVVLFSGLLLFRCCRGAKKMKRRNKKDEKSNVVQLMPGENSGSALTKHPVASQIWTQNSKRLAYTLTALKRQKYR
uniref:Uncharacterized protein LOC111120658 isoform X2 n=1 Tax=Crassostrea virginica TaxID=6565 RepID=A0A8B8CNB2_CRAVI|nr:uncharacterized protein LOC111120658 isoform X2 [Crassostrea virginica]